MSHMEYSVYSFAVDLVLVLIFAGTVLHARRRGFVNAVSGLLSLIGAFIAAKMFGFILEGYLYRTVLAPLITDAAAKALSDAALAVSTSLDAALAAVTAQAQQLAATAAGLGVPVDIGALLPEAVADASVLGEVTAHVTDAVAAPIARQLSCAAAFVILFLAVYLILRLVFGMLDIVMRLPILRTLNRMAGSICGILLGAGYAFVAAHLLSLILGILVTKGTLPPDVLDGALLAFLSGAATHS